MFLAPDSSTRFLVAYEVGLGKTLVARGIIAKAIEHYWDDVDRIDIVYSALLKQSSAGNAALQEWSIDLSPTTGT